MRFSDCPMNSVSVMLGGSFIASYGYNGDVVDGAFGLWALQPWARTAAMIVAAFSLFEAALAFIQFPGTGLGFGMALMPAVILWDFSADEMQEAFGETDTPAPPMSDNV